MTTLQLRVALAAAELKSVTSAAKFLNTSQPNASNSLKLLEEELGFPIFRRTSGGTVPTPKGTEFLVYARQIVDASEHALKLKNVDEVYRLRLGTINYSAAAEPFFALCEAHREDMRTDFRYWNVSVAEGIQALVQHELDIVAAPIMKHQVAGMTRQCKNTRIEIHPICTVPTVMVVRRDHPAVLEGKCDKIAQGSDHMKDYPYVGLQNLEKDTGSTAYNDSDFIQCSYKIFVNDANARLRMIEVTNGFGFGLPSTYRLRKQYNIALFPVKGVSVELFCLTRPGETERPEIQEYITVLKKEMLQILM